MNATCSDRPRLLCRFVRRWRATFAASDATGPGAAHIATCEGCQQFFGACDNLDTALRREAAALDPGPLDGFDERIIRAVRLSQDEEPAAPVRSRRPVLAWAGAAAAFAVVAFVFFRPAPSSEMAGPGQSTPDLNQVLLAAGNLSEGLWSTLKPSALELSSAQPLQQELDSVYSDARTALDFLALNFLPSAATSRAPSLDSEDSSQRG